MARRSLNKPGGLPVADDNVSAGLNQFAAAAAMNGRIVLAEGRFTVNEYGFTSRSGTPPVQPATQRVHTTIAATNSRLAVHQNIR